MSAVQPYSPIHPPEKHVTHERMKEILERRTGQSQLAWPMAPKDPAPESPPRPRGQLRWQPREPGSMGQRDTTDWYSV